MSTMRSLSAWVTVRTTPALAGGAREVLPQDMEALRAGARSRLQSTFTN